MFEPVTKSIEKLTRPAAAVVNPTVKEEEKEGEPIEIASSAAASVKQESDKLYQEALTQIPRKLRDDGQLGLCPTTHQIGHYTYAVYGNILRIMSDADDEDGYEREFEIGDLNLWKLLLVLNPTKIGLKLFRKDDDTHAYLPFVLDYINIAKALKLLESYSGSKNRLKYTLLTRDHHTHHSGSGFLFTSTPPVVILPSDNKSLMSELYRALAELRAGNTMMRNLVVPFAREAARRHILPPNLLTAQEDTWVLA